jgi:hypothetical protein
VLLLGSFLITRWASPVHTSHCSVCHRHLVKLVYRKSETKTNRTPRKQG